MRYAAIFDMDGVLVDSSGAHFVAWSRLGSEIGTPFPRTLFDHTFGMHNNQIIPLWLGASGSTEIERLSLRKEEIYRAVASDVLEPLPGAVALVRALHLAGVSTAVASSGPRANVLLCVRKLALEDAFDYLATGDDVLHGKPNPEIFLKAMVGLGVPAPQCVVIEDAPQGVAAGLASGARVVAVTSSRPAAELHDADRVVDSLTHLGVEDLLSVLGA